MTDTKKEKDEKQEDIASPEAVVDSVVKEEKEKKSETEAQSAQGGSTSGGEEKDTPKIEKRVVKGKKKKKVAHRLTGGRGQAHIKSTYNNTIVTITDQVGNTVAWGSSGKSGFKGPKKSTPYAAGIIVKSLAEKAKEMGVKEVDCFVKGIGSGRESAVRALGANGINVLSIKDITTVPHNGCRQKKPRRI